MEPLVPNAEQSPNDSAKRRVTSPDLKSTGSKAVRHKKEDRRQDRHSVVTNDEQILSKGAGPVLNSQMRNSSSGSTIPSLHVKKSPSGSSVSGTMKKSPSGSNASSSMKKSPSGSNVSSQMKKSPSSSAVSSSVTSSVPSIPTHSNHSTPSSPHLSPKLSSATSSGAESPRASPREGSLNSNSKRSGSHRRSAHRSRSRDEKDSCVRAEGSGEDKTDSARGESDAEVGDLRQGRRSRHSGRRSHDNSSHRIGSPERDATLRQASEGAKTGTNQWEDSKERDLEGSGKEKDGKEEKKLERKSRSGRKSGSRPKSSGGHSNLTTSIGRLDEALIAPMHVTPVVVSEATDGSPPSTPAKSPSRSARTSGASMSHSGGKKKFRSSASRPKAKGAMEEQTLAKDPSGEIAAITSNYETEETGKL